MKRVMSFIFLKIKSALSCPFTSTLLGEKRGKREFFLGKLDQGKMVTTEKSQPPILGFLRVRNGRLLMAFLGAYFCGELRLINNSVYQEWGEKI